MPNGVRIFRQTARAIFSSDDVPNGFSLSALLTQHESNSCILLHSADMSAIVLYVANGRVIGRANTETVCIVPSRLPFDDGDAFGTKLVPPATVYRAAFESLAFLSPKSVSGTDKVSLKRKTHGMQEINTLPVDGKKLPNSAPTDKMA